jgi:hypothetical protein
MSPKMWTAPCSISRRQLVMLAGAALRLRASEPDFWNCKPAEEWTAADIYRLANHSPWANPVQSWTRDPAHSRGGPSSIGAPPPWPIAPEWGPRGVITWESAPPIRDAFKCSLPYVFANTYVIGVDGIPRGAAGNLNRLRQNSVLRSKGKVKWTIRATVARELIRNSAVCAFGFPRDAAPIDADVNEVVFESEFGQWLMEAKFRPKDMLYHGELAL